MWLCGNVLLLFSLLICKSSGGPHKNSKSREVCPEICEPEKCPNVGPIGLSQCPAEQYIVTYRCGCCKRCDVRPVTTTMSPTKRDEVCEKMTCPKKKVCTLNIQGLPVCKCPTDELCRKFATRAGAKKIKVCGTDGITYQSRCHLKVASCASDGKIRVSKKGECKKLTVEQELSTLPVTVKPTQVSRSALTKHGRRQHSNNRQSNRNRNNDKKQGRRSEKRQNKRQNRKREKNYQRALRSTKLHF